MTFPLTSTSSLFSIRKVSLQRHDSSLLNFDLKTAIDDGEDEDENEEEDEVEEVLVFSLATGDDDSNGLLSNVGGDAGVSVIE